MTKDINMNISSISVDEFVKEMSGLFVPVIKNGMPVEDIPAAMLWGAPGVGKSDGVSEFAHELGKLTGK